MKTFPALIPMLATCVLLLNMISESYAEEGAAFSADTDQEVTLPDGPGPITIYTPSNYDPEKKWPAVFYYHAEGASPETGTMKAFTKGENYIVVAMGYAAGAAAGLKTEQARRLVAQAEVKNFQRTVAFLRTKLAVDVRQIYVAGGSKGALTAATIGEYQAKHLAGIILLAAGRPRGLPDAGGEGLFQEKPVFIGVGEKDPNYVSARRAAEYYRWNGARVTFAGFPETAHTWPEDIPQLRDWFNVQGPLRAGMRNPEVRDKLVTWYKTVLERVEQEEDPLKKYSMLVKMYERPRMALCTPSARERVAKMLEAYRRYSPLKEEHEAELLFQQLLGREDQIRSLHDMGAVLEGYQKLVMKYPETRWAPIVASHGKKLRKAYLQSKAATEKRQAGRPAAPAVQKPLSPAFPSRGNERSKYRTPQRSGNTIRF